MSPQYLDRESVPAEVVEKERHVAELTAKDASGGLVAVAPDGTVVVAHNSPTMFAAFEGQDGVVLLT